jgi:penicillin amidase
MKPAKALASVAATLILIWALQTKFGQLPPIGKFLNPVTGFWQNAESKHIVVNQNLKLPGLISKVNIEFDEHRIPHIFAENDHDLYYAQGYLTARDRLWEMDIQTRQAAGRLSEVIGPKALEVDRYHRRMGMVYGAENTLRGMMKDPLVRVAVNAYTDGINSYIHQLWYRDYPIEFKLLDYEPEDWKPINCAFLLKLMSETLAGGSNQFEMTNDLKKFGPNVMNDLFPDYPFHEDPIIPVGTKWNFTPLPIPKPSAGFIAQITDSVHPAKNIRGIGSNNWAIGGSKTATGYPILANDPHLNLTFPSIWYQLQMVSPTVNVYGVSLPGAPGIIIGYNQHISWGVTNVDADVLDWYQVKFKDQSKNEYWYHNRWNQVKRRVEVIGIRGQKPLYDTVLYTHHGPVVYESTNKKPKDSYSNIPVGNALRWIAHDESDEFKTFYLLNRGKNYDDYRKALTYFTAPAQNFVFASNDKDIAITPNGRFPLKFKDQGKYILDGSDPANDWQGWIPADQNPTVKNPPRSFVSSANQSPTDTTYPYYINHSFEYYTRAKRINNRLAAMTRATVDSMRRLQTDTYSIKAEDILPAMLKYIDPDKLTHAQLQVFNSLKNWDKRFDATSVGATVFRYWWYKFYQLTWADEFGDEQANLEWPNDDRTEQLLLQDPNSAWFDNKKTTEKETAVDILRQSFVATVNELTKKTGQFGTAWQWGNFRKFEVAHLAKLPGFGSGNFVTGGTNGVIDAISNGHGPSWRMVVQMGPQVKGYGVFPGGESGNAGSYFYDDMLKTWQQGKLYELLFLEPAGEKSARIKSTLILNNK